LPPIEHERLRCEKEDPLGLQIANFCGVMRGTAEPVVIGREGLKTLRMIDGSNARRKAELSCRFDTSTGINAGLSRS
jgi:hypothetical protein